MAAGTTVQITMPEMGESVTEGTILEWLKQVGDQVEADEGVVEVSTDKVDAEIPAPASGILTKILVGPDETVPTGAVLGEIQVDGGAAQAGNGGAPESAGRDVDFASDESAVEEAEHGAAAETEHQWSAEEPGGNGAGAPSDAPTEAPTERRELVDVTLPEMGESVAEGTVLEWLKQVGDDVQLDGGLVEISTDKVDAHGPAPAGGAPRGGSRHTDPRAGRNARPVHGAEPLDPDGHELPRPRGRHARRATACAEGRRPEALVHASDRVGDRPGGTREAGDDPLLRGAGR